MGTDHDSDVFETPSIDIPDACGRTASITCLAPRVNDQPDWRISDPSNGELWYYFVNFIIPKNLIYSSIRLIFA